MVIRKADVVVLSGRHVLTDWMGLRAEDRTGNGGAPGRGVVGGLRFAFYGRTSTTERQDPVTSRAWQLEVAQELTAGYGTITATFFDAGRSRRDRWRDRPQAAELLAAVRDPDRGFDAIVVGEYERGFAGDQLERLPALFRRHGVQVWLPEAGGPVDLDTPEHRALVRMLGAQSLREVVRARHRAIAAMRTLTEEGRYLGGRAPYGYRLVDAGLHPHPAGARRGRNVVRLEPDPETAPTVRWLFAERQAGRSIDTLAEILNQQHTPCPSAHDPQRNTHRTRRRWTAETVTTILRNPRYTGWQVWNRQSVDHDHHSPTDQRRRRVTKWKPAHQWVLSRQPAHPALVSERDFVAVQHIRAQRPNQHGETRHYMLAGLLRCGTCGRRMEARWAHGRPGYRCRHHHGARTEQTPPTLYYREEQLIVRIGHVLHLPAAASPHTVVDKLRADHAVITCHANRVVIDEPHVSAGP
ncbi:DNA invertase Pin-like site-specific DNA recombinase [Saccharothrix ecbatanensis]|uniref:DNA invertase Pin-like site-specific DNA recombinase n=1 Tax=Saccharothrix ecbatanensis TaxID=1105145 RepID=A0A7W9HJS0_9PSEU|nr:recombinase family protein [Saccharothrix ecbatanensis]MBB5803583.1 DNA invertase Pin-like site-specific DNA recombinase [Saccharothrix ecbatanensis]